MKKKILITLSGTILFILAAWIVISYLIIPKIFVPKIERFINENLSSTVKLSVKHISFHPISGFQLRGISLSAGKVAILNAKNADIDINLMPILWKRVEIQQIEIVGVELNINRGTDGEWNFKPLQELDFLNEVEAGAVKVTIKELHIEKGSLKYSDSFNRENTLKRDFTNIHLVIKNPKARIYSLDLSASGENKKDESINLSIDFNKTESSLEGTARCRTKNMDEYWDYYLDDIFKPWVLKADEITAEVAFSRQEDVLSLKGNYSINNGFISYGDLGIKGNASLTQNTRYIKGSPDENSIDIQAQVDNMALLSGKYILFHDGQCQFVMTGKEIVIEKLSGITEKLPIDLSGNFTFAEPYKMLLTGTISGVSATVRADFPSKNSGTLDLQASPGKSLFWVRFNFSDIKNLSVTLTVDSAINLPDIIDLTGNNEQKVSGKIDCTGSINGELDNFQTMQGDIKINVKDLSFLDIQPLNFNLPVNITNGVLNGATDKVNFYRGTIQGAIKGDEDRFGAEIDIDSAILEKFVKNRPNLTGIKGIFTGNIVLIFPWDDMGKLTGGGYLEINKCDLWNAPVFKNAEEGIDSVVQNFSMPDLKKVQLNYKIGDGIINVYNFQSKASNMYLNMTGKIFPDKMTDFTIGVSFSQGGFLRTIRQVVIPVTIGFDLLASSIEIHVNGVWPDLKHTVNIQPLNWLGAIFPQLGRNTHDVYSLNDFWEMKVESKEDTEDSDN